MDNCTDCALLDLVDIVGRPETTPEQAEHNRQRQRGVRRSRPAKKGLLGICRSSFLDGVKKGIYPAPVRLGRRTLWRSEDIRKLIQRAA